MKILLLCKKLPFLSNDGETIVINSYAEALTALRCEIHLLAMNTSRNFYPIQPKDLEHKNYKSINIADVDNKISLPGAIFQLLKNKSYHISRFQSKEYVKTLISLLESEQFDFVQIESLFLCPYITTIRNHFKGPIFMRSHNLEYKIWESLARAQTNPIKKTYLSILAKQLKTYEISQFNSYNHLFCLSIEDLQGFKELGFRNQGSVINIGLSMSNYVKMPGKKNQIGFIGSLDWKPNQNALLWFVEHVWPQVKHINDIKLVIAGRNTPKEIFALQSDHIEVLGEVNSALDFINDQQIIIAPILEGSGVRVKILEAMALGKAVISTSIGAMGIRVQDGRELRIANTPAQFETAIQELLSHPIKANEMGMAARAFCMKHHDNMKIGKETLLKYNSLI